MTRRRAQIGCGLWTMHEADCVSETVDPSPIIAENLTASRPSRCRESRNSSEPSPRPTPMTHPARDRLVAPIQGSYALGRQSSSSMPFGDRELTIADDAGKTRRVAGRGFPGDRPIYRVEVVGT
jgi:hypothetical protein